MLYLTLKGYVCLINSINNPLSGYQQIPPIGFAARLPIQAPPSRPIGAMPSGAGGIVAIFDT